MRTTLQMVIKDCGCVELDLNGHHGAFITFMGSNAHVECYVWIIQTFYELKNPQKFSPIRSSTHIVPKGLMIYFTAVLSNTAV